MAGPHQGDLRIAQPRQPDIVIDHPHAGLQRTFGQKADRQVRQHGARNRRRIR